MEDCFSKIDFKTSLKILKIYDGLDDFFSFFSKIEISIKIKYIMNKVYLYLYINEKREKLCLCVRCIYKFHKKERKKENKDKL